MRSRGEVLDGKTDFRGSVQRAIQFKSDTHTHTHRVCFSEFMKKLLYVFF